mmetsp:Transcript_28101/g.36487  ORF Transcript_28101/g.36487 Transcript_28101/m.36487 type:complete len:267 (-) Transcript_28101:177-977(-)
MPSSADLSLGPLVSLFTLLIIMLATARSVPTVHTHAQADPTQRTTQPYVTGSSVIGIKYKDGVMIASDTLASYGSMARFKDVCRIKQVGENAIVGAGGEFSDFQSISEMLDTMVQEDYNLDDGFERSPIEIYSYLRAVIYQRRNKFNPLWNNLVVGGFKEGQAFLGTIDNIGTAFEDNLIATGFGTHLALPILRKRWVPDMEEGEARALLEDCLRVCFYRDCRSSRRIQIAKATSEGSMISEPFDLETMWTFESFVQGVVDDTGSW